jgi:hypothetical protein
MAPTVAGTAFELFIANSLVVENLYNAAARWWFSRGGVDVTKFAPDVTVAPDVTAVSQETALRR